MPKNIRYALAELAIVIAIIVIGLFLTEVNKIASWVLNLTLIGVFIFVAGKAVTGLGWGALIDDRNKISLSRLQLIIWTIVILSAFLTAALSNVRSEVVDPLAIAIPLQLWILMGISTTSLVGSPLIKNQKTQEKKVTGDSPAGKKKPSFSPRC